MSSKPQTPKEIEDNGKRLFLSAENLRKSAADLDALMDSLWEAVEKSDFLGEIDDLGDEDGGGKGKWLAPAYAYNASVLSQPLRKPGQKGRQPKAKKIGTITMVVRICNSEDIDLAEAPAWPWLSQACLIIGWHPEDNPDDQWYISDFDPSEKSKQCIHYITNGLWKWHDDDTDYSYFFALPIFALRDETDLRRYVLTPLKTLFNADDPASEAQEALKDIPVLKPQPA